MNKNKCMGCIMREEDVRGLEAHLDLSEQSLANALIKLEQANQRIAEQAGLIESCRYIFDKLCDSNTHRLSDAMGEAVENMNEACLISLGQWDK